MDKINSDGVTILSILTLIIGCLIMSMKIIFRSKCSHVSIFYGLLTVQRSVELEEKVDIENKI